MADTLLIYFNPHQAHSCWALINEQGQFSSALSQGPLADISHIARGKRATVLLDSSSISIDSVNIPGQNKQRQRQAAPFALEEHLADDIEDIHFALAKKSDDQSIAVASINKTLLDDLLEQCKEAGIFADVMGADVLALPASLNNWAILLDEDRALIKTDHSKGLYCDAENLSIILPSLLAQHSDIESISCFHKDDDHNAEQLSTICADADIPLKLKTFHVHPLEIFAQNLTDLRQLNILQGEYTPKREDNLALKPWKAAAALLAVWLLVLVSTAAVESQQLQQKNQELTSQIEKQFKMAIPTARNFNNMRKRVEQKLNELEGGGNDSDPLFLNILANATPAFSQNKNVSISGIVYRNQYVDMDLHADSLQSLEQIKSQLMANKKLKVVMSTSVEKNKTRGRLRLEAQG